MSPLLRLLKIVEIDAAKASKVRFVVFMFLVSTLRTFANLEAKSSFLFIYYSAHMNKGENCAEIGQQSCNLGGTQRSHSVVHASNLRNFAGIRRRD
jgi:hypothetical protein